MCSAGRAVGEAGCECRVGQGVGWAGWEREV
jgi:hypothetical protein